MADNSEAFARRIALESLVTNPDRPPASIAETARLALKAWREEVESLQEKLRTAQSAFGDSILAHEEISGKEFAAEIRSRWSDVEIPEGADAAS